MRQISHAFTLQPSPNSDRQATESSACLPGRQAAAASTRQAEPGQAVSRRFQRSRRMEAP